jgi:serine/threonine-protein kinase RsbW
MKFNSESYKQFTILKKVQFQVPSDLKVLDRVLLQFNQIYDQIIPYQDWLQCQLAIAEGFTNAVRHAHKDLPQNTLIEIEIILKKSALTLSSQQIMEIRIWDWGNSFDLSGFIEKMSRDEQNWIRSGKGVAILTKIADKLEYFPTEDGRNCLLITKHFSS